MAKNEEQVEQVLRALAQDDVRAGDAFKRHLIATLQAHQQRTPFERFWHRLMRPLRQRWMVQWGLVAAMMIVICVGIVLMATPSRYIVLDVLHGQAEVTRSSPIIPWREETTSGAAGGRSISVAEGGHVQVDEESTAVLTFDGSEVTLSPGTQMTVTQARPRSVWQPPSVRMRVRTGEVYARVQSLRTRKGRFEVDMPAALVSVRGTVFRARVISPSHTYVATEEGVVAVTLNDPAQDYPSVDVPAGYEVDARVGQPLVVQPVGARPTTSELATSTVSSVTPDTPTDTPLSSPESMTVTRVPSPTDASSPTSSATETPTSTSALTGTTPTPSLADDADLEVDVLLENSDAIGAGQHLRYAIVVTNWGPATAENVMVTQTLPPAMRFISATLAPDRRPPALVWSLGSLGDDETRVFDVEVYVYRWATGEVTMTAEIAADHSDGNARNNLVRVRTATTKAADLSITATVHPQQVSVGDVVTVTLRYANRGPARAEDVKVQAELSPHMRFGGVVERGAATLIPSSVREAPETGTIIVGDAGGPRWDVGSMEVGDEGQIVFTATVQEEALGTLINTFSVVGYTFDEHKENDKQVVELSALREADLAISRTMTAGGGAVQAGDVITTTLHYVNRGPWEAQRVTITDALPDGVTFGGLVRASSDINWSLTSEEQHITWSAAALPADAHGTLVFTATVGFDAPSELVHQAHIASAMWDRTPDNNEMTHTTEVLAPGLALAHRVRPAIGVPGMPLTYTLDLHNTGAITFAPGSIQLNDLLPAGFDYLTGTAGLMLAETQRLTWANSMPLTPGQRVRMIYVLSARQAISQGTHIGAAQVTATLPAGVLTATRRAAVRLAPPAMSLTHRMMDYALGDPGHITMTLLVHNIGASALTEIPLMDAYDVERATLVRAIPAPDAHEDGRLAWEDLTGATPSGVGHDLQPGEHLSVTLAFSLTAPLSLQHEVTLTQAMDRYGNLAEPLYRSVTARVDYIYLPMVIRQRR